MVSAQIDTCINLTVQLTKIADVQGFPSTCNHASYTECYKLITLPGKGNARLTIALFYILVEWSRWMETVYKKYQNISILTTFILNSILNCVF